MSQLVAIWTLRKRWMKERNKGRLQPQIWMLRAVGKVSNRYTLRMIMKLWNAIYALHYLSILYYSRFYHQICLPKWDLLMNGVRQIRWLLLEKILLSIFSLIRNLSEKINKNNKWWFWKKIKYWIINGQFGN